MEHIWNWNEFQWIYQETPFSDLKYIAMTWALYLVVILAIKFLMKDRKPFDLSYFSAAHNFILFLWSLIMCFGTAVDGYFWWRKYDTRSLFCVETSAILKGRLFFWMWLYYISKFYELIDTVILALKKKPIIFLHWFHHSIVILMVWSWLHYGCMFSIQGMLANTFVHIFMYMYYMLSSLGIDVWFKKYITTLQIVQFITSFALSIPFLNYYFNRNNGIYGDCLGIETFLFSMTCNSIFLGLFIHFYSKTYTSRRPSKNGAKTQ